MEDVYVSFESYDFNGDAKYQDGLKRLRLTDENYDHILKLKISYYNRFVGPIQLDGYLQWLASHKGSRTPTTGDDCTLELQDERDKVYICRDNVRNDHLEGNLLTETGHDERRQPSGEMPTADFRASECSAVSDSEPGASQAMSFTEVFRLIQAGEAIPGVQELNIQPCYQKPTVSKLTRKPKPWEKTLLAP